MIVMALDGFLCPAGKDIRSAAPSTEGKSAYALATSSGIPVTLISDQEREDRVTDWLNLEGFYTHVAVMVRGISPLTFLEHKVKSMIHLLSLGYGIKFYIDSDIEAIRAISALGVPCLFMLSPGGPVGKIHVDQEYTPWTDMVNDLQDRSQIQANKTKSILDIQEAL